MPGGTSLHAGRRAALSLPLSCHEVRERQVERVLFKTRKNGGLPRSARSSLRSQARLNRLPPGRGRRQRRPQAWQPQLPLQPWGTRCPSPGLGRLQPQPPAPGPWRSLTPSPWPGLGPVPQVSHRPGPAAARGAELGRPHRQPAALGRGVTAGDAPTQTSNEAARRLQQGHGLNKPLAKTH